MKKLKDLFGSGPLGFFLVFLLVVILVYIEKILGMGKIVSNNYLLLLGVILIILGLLIMLYSVRALPLSVRGKKLVKHGPYKYVRHPIYSAGIFLIYPGVALMLRSWLVLVSTVLICFIFKIVIKYEEKHVIEVFGEEYEEYMKEAPQFIPRLF